jgi:outer membrane protein assembly factor BamB
MLGEANGEVYMLLKGPQNGYAMNAVYAFNTASGQLLWQRSFTLPFTGGLAPTGGQPYVAGSDMEALLAGNTVYVTGYEAVTTIVSFHMTLSVYQTLNSFFNMTTFTLTSEALDGQTGNVKWQNQQVEQFHVA